jgi:hypothetical protein
MECIVFNPEKHHIQSIAAKILQYAKDKEASLPILLRELVNKGIERESNNYNGIVDLYTGNLSAEQIKAEVFDFLKKNELLDLGSYQRYLETHGQIKRKGHYTSLELSDKTQLTLRLVENEKNFVHIHPSRYSPNTIRIKANTLKTAILTEFLAISRNIPSRNMSLINEARQYLELSPVEGGIDAIDNALELMDSWIEKARLGISL